MADCDHNKGSREHVDIDVSRKGEIIKTTTTLCNGCNRIMGVRSERQ